MAGRIFEYFVVCGIGPEIRTLEGNKGFQGTGVLYLSSLLDQYPSDDHSLSSPPPPQLPTVRFYIIQFPYENYVGCIVSFGFSLTSCVHFLGPSFIWKGRIMFQYGKCGWNFSFRVVITSFCSFLAIYQVLLVCDYIVLKKLYS